MKRRILLFTLCLPLLLGACGQQQAQMEYIGAEKAKTLALTASGLSADQVTDFDTDVDSKNGIDYYQVEFGMNGEKYRYDIDALTGVIIDSKVPNAKDSEFQQDKKEDVSKEQSREVLTEEAITADDAKALALAQVPGATLDDIKGFQTEYDDGRLEYEGTIYYDNMEYEFEIDAYSGTIRDWDVESIYD